MEDPADVAMQVGESFVRSGFDAAHVDSVLGRLGTPFDGAWAAALAGPSAGHVPFLAELQPGVPVEPSTVFVNGAAISSDRHAELARGAAQAGAAREPKTQEVHATPGNPFDPCLRRRD